jgi:hypothetical protein
MRKRKKALGLTVVTGFAGWVIGWNALQRRRLDILVTTYSMSGATVVLEKMIESQYPELEGFWPISSQHLQDWWEHPSTIPMPVTDALKVLAPGFPWRTFFDRLNKAFAAVHP